MRSKYSTRMCERRSCIQLRDHSAIVESYECSEAHDARSAAAALPFTFSAASESSLSVLLEAYRSF